MSRSTPDFCLDIANPLNTRRSETPDVTNLFNTRKSETPNPFNTGKSVIFTGVTEVTLIYKAPTRILIGNQISPISLDWPTMHA